MIEEDSLCSEREYGLRVGVGIGEGVAAPGSTIFAISHDGKNRTGG
jgi:hypothetical protein